jgi:hypothetical protein
VLRQFPVSQKSEKGAGMTDKALPATQTMCAEVQLVPP